MHAHFPSSSRCGLFGVATGNLAVVTVVLGIVMGVLAVATVALAVAAADFEPILLAFC